MEGGGEYAAESTEQQGKQGMKEGFKGIMQATARVPGPLLASFPPWGESRSRLLAHLFHNGEMLCAGKEQGVLHPQRSYKPEGGLANHSLAPLPHPDHTNSMC